VVGAGGAGVLGVLDAGDLGGLVIGVAGGVIGAAGVGLQVDDPADQPAGGLVVGVFLDQLVAVGADCGALVLPGRVVVGGVQ
jgi:hypothetical protein